MLEKMNSELYRKGLASSLQEIRNSGEGGKEKANLFLDLAQQTTLYQDAKTVHRESVTTTAGEAVKSENLPEQQKGMESYEARMVKELLELVSSSKYFSFGLAANGNLYPGRPPSNGNFGYRLDKKSGALVRYTRSILLIHQKILLYMTLYILVEMKRILKHLPRLL